MSTIIAGALKFETCNNLDDDCDGAVDEDFPNKGQPCDDGKQGICKGTGTLICDTDGTGVTCSITNPGGTATTEICNGLDDDCDGSSTRARARAVPAPPSSATTWTTTATARSTRTCSGRAARTSASADGHRDLRGRRVEHVHRHRPAARGLQRPRRRLRRHRRRLRADVPEPAATRRATRTSGICHPGTQVCPSGRHGHVRPVPRRGPAAAARSATGSTTTATATSTRTPAAADCSTSAASARSSASTARSSACDSSGPQPRDRATASTTTATARSTRTCADGPACNGGGTVCNGVDEVRQRHVRVPGPAGRAGAVQLQRRRLRRQGRRGLAVRRAARRARSCQCAFPCSGGEFPCPLGKICNADNFCVNDPCFGVTCPTIRRATSRPARRGRASNACSLICVPRPARSASARRASARPTTARRSRTCARRSSNAWPACASTNPCAGVTCHDRPVLRRAATASTRART